MCTTQMTKYGTFRDCCSGYKLSRVLYLKKKEELKGRVSCISLVLEHQRGTRKSFLFRPTTRGSSTRDPMCIFTLHCKSSNVFHLPRTSPCSDGKLHQIWDDKAPIPEAR